jgi:hypothetical protein
MKKTARVDNSGRLSLYDFRHWLDIYSVKFYSIKVNKDKTLTIKFYDRKRKRIKLNAF